LSRKDHGCTVAAKRSHANREPDELPASRQERNTDMATLSFDAPAFDQIETPGVDPAHLMPIPAHVPPELVRPFPYVLGAKTKLRPHSFIPAIHEGPEVFWAERAYSGYRGAWVPRTLEHLHQIYNDNVNFRSRDFAPFAQLLGEDWYLVPAEADPPVHATLRAMVNPVFTPKKMAVLDEMIRNYAREYVLGFRDKGACEFMRDFAFEFPIKVFLELMGLPQDEVGRFLAWEHKLLHESDLGEVTKATRAVVDYLREQIEDRKQNPTDDLISFGVQVDKDGRKLSENELLGFCFNLFIGGLDTVSTNMAWQFLHLAEHPEHQRMLREKPEMIPAAIDEMMRVYASVATSRECVNETKIGEVTVMPGDKVLLATFLAGHDPAAYPDPEKVILDRAPRHVSFGYGPHLCIGMHLARREMRIAIEEFLTHIPEFTIAPDADIDFYLAAIVQPIELPLVWKA
jgi:cytochrome P450